MQQFAAQTDFIDQRRNDRRIREALRADIEAKSLLIYGIDHAAETTAPLEQEHWLAELSQTPGTSQTRNSAADH